MTTKTIYTILGAMNAFVLRLAGMDHCSFIQTLTQPASLAGAIAVPAPIFVSHVAR